MIAVYWTLAIFFNTTRVTLDRQRLTITHDPVPWPGNRMIPRDCIEQFYCVEKRNRGKGPATATYRYEVWMQARDGGHSRVIAGGPGGLSSDEALALEQQLEQALGIPDRPVSGEFPPNWVP